MISAIPLHSFRHIGGLWNQYQKALADNGLMHQWKQIVDTGRLQHFLDVAAGKSDTHTGYRFNDSDLYKWVEAAAYSQALNYREDVAKAVDEAISAITAAQEEDGYLFTLVQLNKPTWRWANLTHMHEMYCLGHLIEAGVALKEALGDDRLLGPAEKAVSCIMDTFGPEKRVGSCGHPEIELALYRLWTLTGQKKYAELADWMIDCRGTRPSPFEEEFRTPELNIIVPKQHWLEFKNGSYEGSYLQDDKPIRDQDTIVGHSVRAGYLYSAAQLSAARRGDSDLQSALTRIWNNLVERRMYVTGGIGSTGDGEGFTADYDLPNLHAYAETCAGIALMMWARRGFESQKNTDSLDVLERVLFNGVLSGISADTTQYFYENPLESRSNLQRQPWFGCACCPPNVARVIGSVTDYAFYFDAKTLFVAFPIDCEFELPNGLTVAIETNYPHSGKTVINVSAKSKARFRLAFRIPDWAEEVTTDLPGAQPAEYEDGFAVFDEIWEGTRTLTIDCEISPIVVSSHHKVLDNLGRVAIQYGPSIYCAESTNPENAPQLHTLDLADEIEVSAKTTVTGAPILTADTMILESSDAPLYESNVDPRYVASKLDLIPYRDWAGSGMSHMQVWMRS